jgi:hypothetical protein
MAADVPRNDPRRVTDKCVQLAPTGEVPHFQSVVVSCRDGSPFAWSNGHRIDLRRVTDKRVYLAPTDEVPYFQSVIPRCRDCPLSVRIYRNRSDRI